MLFPAKDVSYKVVYMLQKACLHKDAAVDLKISQNAAVFNRARPSKVAPGVALVLTVVFVYDPSSEVCKCPLMFLQRTIKFQHQNDFGHHEAVPYYCHIKVS